MRRREFITLLGGAAAAWPLAARAQQAPKTSRLGVLLFSTPQSDPQMETARRALRDLGYVEGQNLAIEYRSAEGQPERLPDLAADLVRMKPDVLFALGGDVTPAAVKATQTIPIVFTSSADPVQLGFVASLARPGGNATGVTFLLDELASKRLEILKQAASRVSRVGFLWNPDHPDNELTEAERAAASLGVELKPLAVRGPADFDAAFSAATQARVDALYVVTSRLTLQNLGRIVNFAADNRLPLAGGFGAWAKQHGLLSYGPNVDDMTRRAVAYIDRILKGTKPADLPVQQPTRFELVINHGEGARPRCAFAASATRRRGNRVSNCDLVAARSLIVLAASRLALRAPALRAATALTRPNRSARQLSWGRHAVPTAMTVGPIDVVDCAPREYPRNPSLLMRARAQATVRVWKKRPELQAHSRTKVQSGCGLPVAAEAVS